MTRWKKPEAAIAEAKVFAERMGYRWIENPHKELPFDLQIFKPASFRLVKIRQTRYRIDPNGFTTSSSRTRSRTCVHCRIPRSFSASSGCAPVTSGPGAGLLSMSSQSPRSDGGGRMITRTPTHGNQGMEGRTRIPSLCAGVEGFFLSPFVPVNRFARWQTSLDFIIFFADYRKKAPGMMNTPLSPAGFRDSPALLRITGFFWVSLGASVVLALMLLLLPDKVFLAISNYLQILTAIGATLVFLYFWHREGRQEYLLYVAGAFGLWGISNIA